MPIFQRRPRYVITSLFRRCRCRCRCDVFAADDDERALSDFSMLLPDAADLPLTPIMLMLDA